MYQAQYIEEVDKWHEAPGLSLYVRSACPPAAATDAAPRSRTCVDFVSVSTPNRHHHQASSTIVQDNVIRACLRVVSHLLLHHPRPLA